MKLAAVSTLALAALLSPPATSAPATSAPATFASATSAPGRPSLGLPVACEPGRTCEIQHYVDRDPGPGVKDYRCATMSYDAHNGIDFRLPDMAAQRRGVAVLAAAAGRVARLRDGVADISIREPGAAPVANAECGNGVVVDHGGGWETQYCHMAKGSIGVKPGDAVAAGAPLGRVGLSGNTEFPHLHFTVRHNGQAVDPFAPDSAPACGARASLWRPDVQAKLTYRSGAVLNAGFTEVQLGMADLEAGRLAPVTAASPLLVAYARGIALLPGDVVEIELKGPDGAVLAKSRGQPLPRWRAHDLVYVGKRRPATGWPRGTYVAEYRVWRAGAPAVRKRFSLAL
jgi:hypothetical protein